MQQGEKHVPIRTCIACGTKRAKSEFIRFANVNSDIIVDPTGKARGRGANVCMQIECLEIALKKDKLKNALKYEGKISEAKASMLRNDFEKTIEEKEFRPDNKPVKVRLTKDQTIEKIDE